MITAKSFLFTLTTFSSLAFSTASGAQTWTTLSDIKNPRFESTAVQYNDDIYVFNGFGPGIKVESSVEKFDAGTQKWSVIGHTSAAQGTGVTHNGVIRTGNEVWIIGGRVGNHPGAVTSKVWKFNLNTEKWSAGPKLPVPVAAGGAALVNNKVYWFGGLDKNAQCDVDSHFVYDLNKPSAGWKDISSTAPMPIPRNHFATVVHNDLIYAIGGQFTHDGCGAGTPDTNLMHVFNPKTNTWTQKASLPAIQSHIEPSSFLYKDAIYVVGGATSGNKVYRYDPLNNDWDTVATLPQALLAPVARVVDGKLIVSTGGAPAITPIKTTYVTDMAPLELSRVVVDTPVVIDVPVEEKFEEEIIEAEIAQESLSICLDTFPVGDGWGWNGTASCRIANNTTTASGNNTAFVCLDPDGDGWGWDGSASCRVTNTATAASTEPATQTACLDPDGDGWGWNGTASCKITTTTNTPVIQTECIDLDGDGWGWDGSMSCLP